MYFGSSFFRARIFKVKVKFKRKPNFKSYENGQPASRVDNVGKLVTP